MWVKHMISKYGITFKKIDMLLDEIYRSISDKDENIKKNRCTTVEIRQEAKSRKHCIKIFNCIRQEFRHL